MGGLRSMDGAMGADVSEVLIEPASVPEDQPVALELPAADGSCPVIALSVTPSKPTSPSSRRVADRMRSRVSRPTR